MTITVFLKSTVRPCPSVMRPSSSTCSSTLKTSGCAFSISSSRITEYGLRRTSFGQITAFLVADVSRRRADEARDRMLLHELRHVDADQVIFRIEQELRERLAKLGLADARGPEEQERAIRPLGIAEARALAADRVRDEAHGFVLADDALCSASSMSSSFSRSPCIIFETGMPVMRDTTSAISSAPTCVRSSRGFACASLALSPPASTALRAAAACRTGAPRPCRTCPRAAAARSRA